MSGGYPVPQRIGDAERDRAVQFLQEHHSQGRLDPTEFDERMTAALRAKTQADLDRLFTDLPSPTPRSPGSDVAPLAGQPPASQPSAPASVVPKRLWGAIDIVVGAIWPITLLVLFALHWDPWYLIFVPIIVSSIWGRRKAQERADHERIERANRHQLGHEGMHGGDGAEDDGTDPGRPRNSPDR
ncbi:DUF1707 domain-containing protein [Microlunatus sp. Gsoil 973]|uniref:DUF1707 SHOCT-like domain-containing protein n=1 Tax=Microlunatus sp. Gsoil 973 TaxID=2672569 RepID=UPI0018A86D16|nr:DUF1707 domain-containing protein [Microlunatus sp. Gsoil 973]